MNIQEHSELFAYAKKAAEQLRSGTPLFGRSGVFSPLIKTVIDLVLEAEMTAHLTTGERRNGNRRNGYQEVKSVRTGQGLIDIKTPRDRAGTFEPQLVRKRETILTDSLEKVAIGLYSQGLSLQDISSHLEEMYEYSISTTTLSAITNKIIPDINTWQNRPLEPLYCIVWMDAMYYKVMQDGRYLTKCVYNILGVNVEGKKELLGMYVAGTEGAAFWLNVLSNLQKRGVEDILIACTDSLKGFPDAIASIYPKTEVQLCIVHQVRNSIKFVSNKDRKEFITDLQIIYRAHTEEEGKRGLTSLRTKWHSKYPGVIKSWEEKWENLSSFYKYSNGIRTLIYTTNTIESYHKQIRRVTKNKGPWESDMSLTKLLYLASMKIQKRWTKVQPNWALIIAQLAIQFEERVRRYIRVP